MISMTGVGCARGQVKGIFFSVEIRTVNHKYCEVHARLPARYSFLENKIITAIKKRITRGKIEVSVHEDRVRSTPQVNKTALKAYAALLENIRKTLKLEGKVGLDLILAGSSHWMNAESDGDALWPGLSKLVDVALADLKRMREREGASLAKNLKAGLGKLIDLQRELAQKRAQIVSGMTEKVGKRIKALVGEMTLDQARLAQEVAHLADRSDITEEIDRLTSHFNQMRVLMESGKPCGRPLDFLVQEINREWNTVGSKAQDATVAHVVVEAKTELEKIREQIQNIE